MMEDYGFVDRLKHAWSAFKNRDPTGNTGGYFSYGPDVSINNVRPRFSGNIEKNIIAALYTRIAIDVAAIDVRHVRVDENGRYLEEIDDNLNQCLTMSANLDQDARAFIQDVAMSLFDEGVIAIVPVQTTANPTITEAFDVKELRVGQIKGWYPEHVRLRVYNQATGTKDEVVLPKHMVAIITNPLFSVMNEPSGVVKRLIRKMNQLDAVDNQSSSGKLDVIIQLPYTVKSETRKKQAEDRRKDIESQLTGSKYGIAYIDATERITQLNRPAENNLMEQIEYLTKLMYNQLGISEEVFSGTAEEAAMINYHNRTVEPILAAICKGMTRTFLSKTARTQGQRIMYYRDPFKLVPVSQIAEIADKFTRNEIMSSNDIRSIMGMRPSDDPRADELRNKNLNADNDQLPQKVSGDNAKKETNPMN